MELAVLVVLVVGEPQPPVFDVQAVAAALVAVREQYALVGRGVLVEFDGDGGVEGAEGDEPGGPLAFQLRCAREQGEGAVEPLLGGIAPGQGAAAVPVSPAPRRSPSGQEMTNGTRTPPAWVWPL
ncbi:hypothetical protein ACFYYM_17530 [Streptomyces erythrochromogenes]|uniref:hypothetical protein n=1 Tax=Streptomyces erythrochromogenes TaxID=285574 RepID=UPI0036829DBD